MKTRSLYLLAGAAGIALFALAVPQPLSGQISLKPTPTPVPPKLVGEVVSPQMEALIAETAAQNKQIMDNQDQIDAKIETLNQAIREARIMAARGKGGAK